LFASVLFFDEKCSQIPIKLFEEFISVKFELSVRITNTPLLSKLPEPIIVTLLIFELSALHKINSDILSLSWISTAEL